MSFPQVLTGVAHIGISKRSYNQIMSELNAKKTG